MDDVRSQDQTRIGEVFWPESDDSLAARAAADPAALSELYDRLLPVVDRYCRRKLHQDDQIEDVVSLIFLKMVEGIRRERIVHIRPWLFTIAHNEVVNAYRKRRIVHPIEDARDLVALGNSLEDNAIASGTSEQVHALLPKLSKDEQRLVELRLFGLTNAEICEQMGRSAGWVRTTQFRAYARLRKLLTETFPEGWN